MASSLLASCVLLNVLQKYLIKWIKLDLTESLSLQPEQILLQLACSLHKDRLVFLRSLDIWSLHVTVGAWFTLLISDVRCFYYRKSGAN